VTSALGSAVWDVIDKVSQLVGILTIVPAFLAWFGVKNIQRQRRQLVRQLQTEPGSRPALLIVSIDKPIRSQVEAWRQQQEGLKGIPEERVFDLSWDRRLDFTELDDFIVEFRKVRARVMQAGVTKIHLFYAGPVVVAALIGAELSNGCPVILYHMEKHGQGAGEYVNWGPLDRP